VPFVLAIVAAVALMSRAGARDDKEPVYQGQPLSAWIADLKSEDLATRWVALRAIAEIGPKAEKTVKPMAKLLASPVAGDRERAAEALGRIGPDAKETMPALAKLVVGDPDHLVAEAAAVALEQIDPPFKRTVPDLTKDARAPSAYYRLWAAEDDAAVRKAAVAALARVNPKEAITTLTKALQEKANYRIWAVKLLGRMGPEAKEATATLAKLAAEDYIPAVRQAAAAALTRINPQETTATLTKALQDADSNNRAWAAEELGLLGPKSKEVLGVAEDLAAMPKLIEAKEVAILAGTIGPVKFSPDGKLLATGTADGVKLWDTATWKKKTTLPKTSMPVAFSSSCSVESYGR
jgi:HEAT repeat protein